MGFVIVSTLIVVILSGVTIIESINSKEEFFNKATFNLVLIGDWTIQILWDFIFNFMKRYNT